MKRSATEILRRGFESMLANWQLLAIRIAESVILLIIAGIALVAVVVPLIVSLGFDSNLNTDSIDPSDIAATIQSAILDHLIIIAYVLVVVLLMLVVLLGVHAFVVGGCARIYVDAERKSLGKATPSRADLRAFTGDRWLEGGKQAWWSIFWIYNMTWTIASMIIVTPFFVLLAVMLIVRENAPVVVVTGCVGLIVGVLFILPVLIVTGVWTERAVVDTVALNTGSGAALRSAWRELRADPLRHIGIALVMMVISFAAAMLFGGFSALGHLGHHSGALMLVPMQLSSSLMNSIFSAAVGAWFLASFAALAAEPRS